MPRLVRLLRWALLALLAFGLLGVLGPTRMPYPRAIPTVRYLSGLMNELINSHYGETQ